MTVLTLGHDETLAFLRFGERDASLLRAMRPAAEGYADHFVSIFAAQVYSEPAVQAVLSRAGSSPERHRGHQRQYFLELFGGVYDERYIERRRAIGAVHASIGVTFDLYLGAYQRYLELAPRVAERAFRFRPWLRRPAAAALRKLLVFDIVLALGEYERRREEQVERASRLATIGQTLTAVAHELNNPLTSVLGFAELLAANPSAQAFREDLDLLRREASRARQVVQDLLLVSRPAEVARQPVRISDVVAHVERLRGPEWRRRRLTVEIDVREPSRPVLGSESQLTQVLLNLVTNAEDALAGRPGGLLSIRAREEGGRLVLDVADNGPGVPEELRERIFEPFFTTKGQRGTGLGLGISRAIVEAYGGTLELVAAGGPGATFRVTLPLGDRAPAEESAQRESAATRPLRVLVVDDEPAICQTIGRSLATRGHEVRCAASASEAAAVASEWRPDLVICDYWLAGGTARDVLSRLRQVGVQVEGRVLLTSGAATSGEVRAFAAQQGLPVLAKPFAHEELLAAIAQLADR
ncbi:MAG: protoglobin domain-containing protein [Chloroflexota bacterium]|nr:protoglobin domain-containing protein [Dehalococcoidia bacterium]MDW8047305.1 protoglobin domain-containing protein [Chloroflexota bacterium]